jgi:hypothetical protein
LLPFAVPTNENNGKIQEGKLAVFEFKTTTKVKIRFLDFHLLPSVEYLDAEALSRAAKATIDVGFYKTSCCERYGAR